MLIITPAKCACNSIFVYAHIVHELNISYAQFIMCMHGIFKQFFLQMHTYIIKVSSTNSTTARNVQSTFDYIFSEFTL